jgi:tripartite-type tricarboxylate transporter receptor subunit TctC
MSASVVVENKPGANGVLATDFVVKQPPDGHTLLMTGSTHFINQSLYKNLPFDSIKDFTQVAKAVDAYLVLVVPANSPFDTLKQLVDHMAANPDKMSYASSGNGSTPHMAGALLMKVANVHAVHVPYKRGDQAIADTVGGQFAMTFSAIPPVITLIKGGKLKALAVTGPKRSFSLPDVPTIQESGYPAFDMIPHVGMMARSGTPEGVVKTLSESLVKILESNEFKQFAIARGMEPVVMDAQQYSANSRKMFDSWANVIRVSGARVE